MRTLIVGGGIGGLAAAIALQSAGIEVVVLEQAPVIAKIGAGLSLWPNALRVLRKLGVEKSIIESGSLIRSFKTVAADGTELSEINLREFGANDECYSVCIWRAELQKVLLQRLAPGALFTGARCCGFRESKGEVIAQLADGREVKGEILIGADGIHSVIRQAILGDRKLNYAGYTSWRGIAHVVDPRVSHGEALLALGPGSQIGLLGCGPGMVYWFATKNGPAGEAESPEQRKADVLRLSRNWISPIPEILQMTPANAILQTDIFDRQPCRTWGSGPVTLLGDAAHPATPNLGQGACQALEDAVVLAACLSAAKSPASLRRYEYLRYQRTSRIVRASRLIGSLLQLETPALVRGRNFLLRTRLAHSRAIKFYRELIHFEFPERSEM